MQVFETGTAQRRGHPASIRTGGRERFVRMKKCRVQQCGDGGPDRPAGAARRPVGSANAERGGAA